MPTWLLAWAGEELTKRDDIDVSRFIQPFAALDEFPPEIAKMRDRPAEARKPEPQKDEQHFEERPASRRPGFDGFFTCGRAHALGGGGAVIAQGRQARASARFARFARRRPS
jgi:hypothetical protein